MNKKYGTQILNSKGQTIELAGMVKLWDKVVWNGRKYGSCEDDHKFTVGEKYPVCMIYESNSDLELSIDTGTEQFCIRAHKDEYSILQDQ